MQWIVKSQIKDNGTDIVYDRNEIVQMLSCNELSYNDLVKKQGSRADWKPIYANPEITTPLKSFLQGLKYLKLKRFNKAEQSFNASLNIPNLTLWSSLFLGLIHSYKSNFRQAIPFYKACLQLEDFSWLIKNNLAVCLLYSGEIQEAERLLFQISVRELSSFWIVRIFRLWKEKFLSKFEPEKRLEKVVLLNRRLFSELTKRPLTFHEAPSKTNRSNDRLSQEKDEKGDQSDQETTDSDYLTDKKKKDKQSNNIEKFSFLYFMGINDLLQIKKDLLKMALVIEPHIYFDNYKIYPAEEDVHNQMIQEARLYYGMDLFNAGNSSEARQIFKELSKDINLVDQANKMIEKCDQIEQENLVHLYREQKNNKNYQKALDILNLLEHKFSRLDFIDPGAEKQIMQEILTQEEVERVKGILQSEYDRVQADYENMKAKKEIDFYQVLRIKEQTEKILNKTEYYRTTESEFLIKLQVNLQRIIQDCRMDIKTWISNDLEGKYLSYNNFQYLENVLQYKENFYYLCQEVGIEIDKAIDNCLQRCADILNDLKTKQDHLTFDSIYYFIKILNNYLIKFPANKKLKSYLSEALPLVFSNFVSYMEEKDVNEMTYCADKEQKEFFQSIYHLHKELKVLNDIKDDYLKAKSIGSIAKRLENIVAFASEKNQQIQDKCVENLQSLLDFFNNHNDFENELFLINLLIDRLHITDKKLLERRDICQLNLQLLEFAPIKHNLKSYLDDYRNMSRKALNQEISLQEMEDFLNRDPDIKRLFSGYVQSLDKVPGTSLREWQSEITRYSNIIKQEYEKRIISCIQECQRKNVMNEACVWTKKYIQLHPEDFFDLLVIRDIIKTILNKEQADRLDIEKDILELTGVLDQEIFNDLIKIINSDKWTVRKEYLNSLRNVSSKKLLPVINYYEEKIQAESKEVDFDSLIQEMRTLDFENLEFNIQKLADLNALIQDPKTKTLLPNEKKQEFWHLQKQLVHMTVEKLDEEIRNNNYDLAKARLDNLPAFFKQEIDRDLLFQAKVYPELVLNQVNTTIEQIQGKLHVIGIDRFKKLVTKVETIFSSKPKQAGELKDRLGEEINKDTVWGEETKKECFDLLQK